MATETNSDSWLDSFLNTLGTATVKASNIYDQIENFGVTATDKADQEKLQAEKQAQEIARLNYQAQVTATQTAQANNTNRNILLMGGGMLLIVLLMSKGK